MVFHSQYADVAPVDLPIHEAVLGRSATEHAALPALIDGQDGTTLSYAELDGASRRIAAALADAGVLPGDVLALHSPNTIAYPAVFYAASRCGAAVTTVHPCAHRASSPSSCATPAPTGSSPSPRCWRPPAAPPSRRAASRRCSSATAPWATAPYAT